MTEDKHAHTLRAAAEEFAHNLGLDLTPEPSGRIDLLVGQSPVTLAPVQREGLFLWVGCDLGPAPEDDRTAIAWLLNEAFNLWTFDRISLGEDPETGRATAYILLPAAGLTAALIEAAVRQILERTPEIIGHLSARSHPDVLARVVDPLTMTSHV